MRSAAVPHRSSGPALEGLVGLSSFTVQDLSQARRDRFLENIVVELVKQIFPVGSAVEKGGDPIRHGG
jgi:hypothetical protein